MTARAEQDLWRQIRLYSPYAGCYSPRKCRWPQTIVGWLAGGSPFTRTEQGSLSCQGARPDPKKAAGGASITSVKGNQEDINLIINASGTDLILANRSKGRQRFVQSTAREQTGATKPRLGLHKCRCPEYLRFHLLLISPSCPNPQQVDWPAWTGTKPPWIPLHNWPSKTLEVGRCDKTGTRLRPPDGRESEHWCIIPSKVSTIAAEETGTPAP